MSYLISTFTSDLTLIAGIYKWYPTKAPELTAIATALSADTTTHSAEMTTAPVGLKPGQAINTPFTNDCLLVVNAGKGGNLTPAAMSAAITTAIAGYIPPANSAVPVISGALVVGDMLTCSAGTWTGSPDLAFQWLRGAANITGATGATYTTVVADEGAMIGCRVTGTNEAGSASAGAVAVGPIIA